MDTPSGVGVELGRVSVADAPDASWGSSASPVPDWLGSVHELAMGGAMTGKTGPSTSRKEYVKGVRCNSLAKGNVSS